MQLMGPASIVVATALGVVPATCATTRTSVGGLSFTSLAVPRPTTRHHVAVPVGARLCSAAEHLKRLLAEDARSDVFLHGPVRMDGQFCLEFPEVGTAEIVFGVLDRPGVTPFADTSYPGWLQVEVVPLEELELDSRDNLQVLPEHDAISATGQPLPTDLGRYEAGDWHVWPGDHSWYDLPLAGVTARGLPVLLEPEHLFVEVEGHTLVAPDDAGNRAGGWILHAVEGGHLTLGIQTSAGRQELLTLIGASEDDIAEFEVVAWSSPAFPRDVSGDYPSWMHGFREPTLLEVVRGVARDDAGRVIHGVPFEAAKVDLREMAERLPCQKPTERFGEYETTVRLNGPGKHRAEAWVQWGIDPELHDLWLEREFGAAYDSLEAWDTKQSFAEFVDEGFAPPPFCEYDPPLLPGCGCSTGASPSGLAPLALLGLVLGWRRRRRG